MSLMVQEEAKGGGSKRVSWGLGTSGCPPCIATSPWNYEDSKNSTFLLAFWGLLSGQGRRREHSPSVNILLNTLLT